MTQLTEGKVILFGGTDWIGKIYDDTWIYELDKNTWTKLNTPTHPSKRFDHGMAQIADGKVLLFGGEIPYFGDTWLFDIKTMNWTELHPNSCPYRRSEFAMTQLAENQAVLFGGIWDSTSGLFAVDTWVFNLKDTNWDFHIEYWVYNPDGREYPMMALLDNSRALLFGGWNADSLLDDTWIYDDNQKLKSLKWKQIFPKIKANPIGQSSMTQIDKNIVLWFGGLDNRRDSMAINETWFFRLRDTTWNQLYTAIMPPARSLHRITKISDNKVLLFGGDYYIGNKALNDTWLLTIDSIPSSVENTLNEDKNNIEVIQSSGDEIIVKYNLLSPGTISLKIFDIHGCEVYRKENQLAIEGENREIIPFDNQPEGVYIVFIVIGNNILYGKFVYIR